MTPAISVAGLTRRYRGQLALKDITLDLEAASITGLLGRNGAGKPVTELRRSFPPGAVAGLATAWPWSVGSPEARLEL